MPQYNIHCGVVDQAVFDYKFHGPCQMLYDFMQPEPMQSFSLQNNLKYWYYKIGEKNLKFINSKLPESKRHDVHDIILPDNSMDLRNHSMNLEIMRKSEIPSSNIMASAKGLAELGSNLFGGHLISEKGVTEMHANRTVKMEVIPKWTTDISQGGVNYFSQIENAQPIETKMNRYRHGFFGW